MKKTIFSTILIFAFCFAAFAQPDNKPCPQINVSTISESARVNQFVAFIAEVSREIDQYKVKYNWSVDTPENIEIIAGQGTKILIVLRKSDDVTNIFLEIEGLPKNCKNTDGDSIPAIDPPLITQIDEFGKITQGDKKARMDNFFIALNNNPNASGIIVISSDQDSANQLKFYNNYFNLKKFDKTRVVFVITDEIKESTQLFIIPLGAEKPTFENSLTIQVEDFDRLKNLFLPKPNNRKK